MTMKKKLLTLALATMATVFLTHPLSAQEEISEGLFLKFEETSDLFTEKDDLMMIEKFYLHNFPDGQSSKYLHLRINAIKDVIKFGIASSSEEKSKQRRCYIKLPKDNYHDVFKQVLQNIPVDYIMLGEEKLTINEFIDRLKS